MLKRCPSAYIFYCQPFTKLEELETCSSSWLHFCCVPSTGTGGLQKRDQEAEQHPSIHLQWGSILLQVSCSLLRLYGFWVTWGERAERFLPCCMHSSQLAPRGRENKTTSTARTSHAQVCVTCKWQGQTARLHRQLHLWSQASSWSNYEALLEKWG